MLAPLQAPADLLWVGALPGVSEELLFRGALIPAIYPDWCVRVHVVPWADSVEWSGTGGGAKRHPVQQGSSSSSRGSCSSLCTPAPPPGASCEPQRCAPACSPPPTLLSRRGAAIAGLAFGALHVGGGRNPAFAAWASLVGCAYGGLFLATGCVACPALAHALANIAAAALFVGGQGAEAATAPPGAGGSEP